MEGVIGKEGIAATTRRDIETHAEPPSKNLEVVADAGIDLLQGNEIGSCRRNDRLDSGKPITMTAKAAYIIGHDSETGHSCLLLRAMMTDKGAACRALELPTFSPGAHL